MEKVLLLTRMQFGSARVGSPKPVSINRDFNSFEAELASPFFVTNLYSDGKCFMKIFHSFVVVTEMIRYHDFNLFMLHYFCLSFLFQSVGENDILRKHLSSEKRLVTKGEKSARTET